jgi:mannose-6-phosphate isomerase-like protein (cupin superfamily)
MITFRLSDHRNFSPDKLRKNNLVDTPNLFVDLYCLSPGQEQKPHRHGGSDKIYIVLEGRGRFRVGTEESELEPGLGVLAPSGEEHAVRNASADPLVVLVMMAPKP